MNTLLNPSRRRLLTGKQPQQPAPLRLPWVVNEATFKANCTQCYKCVDICQTSIITFDEQGFPKVDLEQDECTFCHYCTDVCKQPIFTKDKKNEPWPIRVLIADNCLAKNNVYCQSCRDVCETSAITFSHFNNDENGQLQASLVPQPTLTQSDCTLCGACLSSCPQGAIAIHRLEEQL